MTERPINDVKLWALPGVYEALHPRVQGALKIGTGTLGSAVTTYIQTEDGTRVAVDIRVLRRIA